MPSPPNEIERKFAVNDGQVVDKLAQTKSLAGLNLSRAKRVDTRDTYLDAPDFSLLRRGLTLRLRQTEKGTQVTLKSLAGEADAGPGSILQRMEIEAVAEGPYTPESTGWLPVAIHDYLSGVGLAVGSRKSRRLIPYLRLDQTRVKRYGTGDDGIKQVELSLDQVQILPPAIDGVESIAHFQEIEFETLSDAGNLWLQELDSEPLLAGLAPLVDSKLGRGLRAWGNPLAMAGEAGAAFAADAELGHALRDIWREQLAELLLLEHEVRVDKDVEAVHQMRVALRRARTAARFLAQPQDQYFREKLLQPMRRYARLLGAVRDLDVALINLAQPENAEADGRTELRARRSRARAKAFRRLMKWLDSKPHARFIRDLARYCGLQAKSSQQTPVIPSALTADSDLLPSNEIRPTQVRHVFPTLLMEQYMQIRAYERLLEPPWDFESVPDETIHALRIECKRLRYMLEFSRHLLPKRIERFLTRLRRIQELLGEFNDASVEAGRVAGLKDEAERLRMDELKAQMQGLRSRLPGRLGALLEPKSRRQFVLSIAEI